MIGEPLGNGASDAAETAGDEVCAVLSQTARHKGWRREDDLSDVPRGAHEVQGGPCLGERPPAVDYGPQLTRRKPRHNVSQDDANPCRVGLLHDVQFKDVVGNVGTHCRHLFMAEDVPSRHLDESTALSKAR